MDVEKNHPFQEEKAQKAAKQVKIGQKRAERRSGPQDAPPAWLSAPMLNGEPFLATTSIKDFQGGTTGYMANAVE